ncbi:MULTISPECIES: hypothetical protein [Methylobacterium]|uniref:hypothetical protein n=1 Tax=Methylobacterium TaxID=407 RepID=UPI001043D514|nr:MULTISPECIES: hypothetical protein [Methylobacterium]MDR7040193.1 hypothetical protein [Methylobacterium sp. BE186]
MRAGRRRCAAALGLWLGVLGPGAAPAQPAPADEAIACDSLVALRLLTAGAGGDHAAAAAAARLASQPACRRVPRDAIGAVERRAMIGGAPFECLAVRGSAACLWLLP